MVDELVDLVELGVDEAFGGEFEIFVGQGDAIATPLVLGETRHRALQKRPWLLCPAVSCKDVRLDRNKPTIWGGDCIRSASGEALDAS